MKAGTQVLADPSRRLEVRLVGIDVRRGPSKGTRAELDADPIRIGSSDGCHVVVRDPTVSGVHVEVTRSEHGLLIRDLNSTNGTRVDGRRIQALYADGAVTLSIGSSELRVAPLHQTSPVEVSADDRFGDLLGASMPMRAVFAKLKRVAATDSTVLLSGETGTGKELAADGIRQTSKRAKGPFVVVDCGSLPANLIESELFGHERGAFTGAERTRPGAFERASGGTIFLDEIGELPLSLQPALLGILERREARRVGGEKPIPVDVRVITATNRDLSSEVARGAFRADLYYRLAVVEIRMPALRERPEDLPILIEHFLAQLPNERPAIGGETLAQLQSYPWPGNVRELKNVIERAALLSEAPRTGTATLSPAATSESGCSVDIDKPFKDQKNDLISSFERSYVQALLLATEGNIAAAARKAQIDRMYLYKLIERYALELPTKTK